MITKQHSTRPNKKLASQKKIVKPHHITTFHMTALSPFHSTPTLLRDISDNRSKGNVIRKKVEESPKKEKKELSQDQKDKKKLEKLEREKKKEETRKLQLNRSKERSVKETQLHEQKLLKIQQIAAQRFVEKKMDDAERAEYERHHKQMQREEEEERNRAAAAAAAAEVDKNAV